MVKSEPETSSRKCKIKIKEAPHQTRHNTETRSKYGMNSQKIIIYLILLVFNNRFQPDSGKHFRIIEERGEQKYCNQIGTLIKPFDPNLTGKFNYNKRL